MSTIKALNTAKKLKIEKKRNIKNDEIQKLHEEFKKRTIDLKLQLEKLKDESHDLDQQVKDQVWARILELKKGNRASEIKVNFMGTKRFRDLRGDFRHLIGLDGEASAEIERYHSKCEQLAELFQYFDEYYDSKNHANFIAWCVDNGQYRYKDALIQANTKLINLKE